VHGLLEGIEGKESEGGTDRGFGRAGRTLVREQPGHGLERELPQPLPLEGEPLLERRLRHAEAGQEVALVEGDRARRMVGVAGGRVTLERRHIGDDDRRVQGNRAGLEADCGRVGGQAPAKSEERLPEGGPRPRLRRVAPEERRQLVPRVRPARRKRQIGEQCLGFPGRQRDGRP
jgi:hypothetical protein